jgi:hypothetical protein
MWPSTPPVVLFGMLLALANGCGKARSRAPSESAELDLVPCNPLQNSELAASMSQPLGVARDRAGTLYAMSRVGSRSVAWSSLDDQLIAYGVFQENRALTGTIFGVEDGSDGFALTLSPEAAPTSIRLFQDLEDAAPRGGFNSTTGGRFLEMLPPSALTGFDVATRISPAQLIGSYRTLQFIDGPESADLLLVRSGAASAAPPAVFYGTGGLLLERRVQGGESSPDGASIDVQFLLDGEPASVHVEGNALASVGSLRVGEFDDPLLRGIATPLGLSQLEFRCAAPLRQDWTGTEPSVPAARCAEQRLLFSCVESSASRVEDGALITELAAARVEAIGVGTPPVQAGSCSERIIEVVHDFESVARWARLSHDAGESWLALVSPEAALPFGVGDTLALRFWERAGSGAADPSSELELRSASGELLVWLASADDLSLLQGVPEFEFTRGPESCARVDYCSGGLSQYALDSWHIDGDALHVAYGQQLQQGPFRVHNGGFDVQNATPGCAEAAAGQLRVAVWRATAD